MAGDPYTRDKVRQAVIMESSRIGMGLLYGGDLTDIYGGDAPEFATPVGGKRRGRKMKKDEKEKGRRHRSSSDKKRGGDWQEDLRNAFDPNKNGLNRSIADTKAKIDASNAKIKNEFTNPNSKLAQFGRKVKNEFENPDSKLAQFGKKVKNEFVNPKSVLREKILPVAAKIAPFVAPELAPFITGAQQVNQAAQSVGLGMKKKGAWSEEAKERARRRSADPKSHASKVKAYMKKHKGVSLAEASSAVSKM
jgi:hypothetical protein